MGSNYFCPKVMNPRKIFCFSLANFFLEDSAYNSLETETGKNNFIEDDKRKVGERERGSEHREGLTDMKRNRQKRSLAEPCTAVECCHSAREGQSYYL